MSRRTLAAKSLADLESLAREQDWTIRRLPGGHYEWRSPAGAIVHVASTPKANGNAYENVKSDLRQAGLILSRADWRKIQRDRRTALAEMQRHRDRLERALINGGFGEYAEYFEEADDELVLGMIGFVQGTDAMPSLVMKCECGKQSAHPRGFIAHLARCTEHNKPTTDPTEEGDVKRDLRDPPPQEQRIDCPDCGQFYWISQPHLLERHVSEEHGKSRCPYCKHWYIVARGGLTKHMRACSQAHIRLVDDGEGINMVEGEHEVRVNGALPIEVEIEVEHTDPIIEVVPDPDFEPEVIAPDPEPEEGGPAQSGDSSVAVDVAATEAVAQEGISEPVAPVAVATQATSLPNQMPMNRGHDVTDEDLWALLEMVLAGPIRVNRESYAAINEWMTVTRKLMAMREHCQ